MRLYRNFVVLTQSMRNTLQAQVPGARCTVIPNGVDDRLFDLRCGIGDTILYLGRIDLGQKGLDLLLRSYARLPSPRPRLVIAGHGYEQDSALRLATELGIGADLDWFGRYDADEREKLLTAARFVCVPSREETFGMVIAEACAAGKPVVLFDRAPMNEVVTGSGPVLVPPFDTDAYAAAMQSLILAPAEEILRRGEACRRGVAHLNWDSIASQQEEFYLEAAARRANQVAGG